MKEARPYKGFTNKQKLYYTQFIIYIIKKIRKGTYEEKQYH